MKMNPVTYGPGNIPEFGIKRDNEERRDGGCGIVFDPQTQQFALGLQGNGRFRLFAGGVESDEDIQLGVLREVTEESGLYDFLYVERIAEAFAHFHNPLKNINRVGLAVCFLVILKSRDLIPVQLEPHEKFTLTWATVEEVLKNWKERNQNHDHDHWIYFLEIAQKKIKEFNF